MWVESVKGFGRVESLEKTRLSFPTFLKQLFLSMLAQAIELTIQKLIGSGMNPRTENNPYLGFIFTSFQERATCVCHGNTARKAMQCGDKTLGKICGAIAADEKRHAKAYTTIMDELFRQ